MMDTAAPPAVRVRQMSRDSTDGTTTPEEDRGVTLVRDMFTHIEASGIRLLEIFFSVDTQGKGDLNLHEFSEALARMCFEEPYDWEATKEAFAELDEDNNGSIEIEEFMRRYISDKRERRQVAKMSSFSTKKSVKHLRRMPPDQMYEAIRIEGADQWSRAVALQTLSTWNGFDDMDESEIQWRKEEAEAKFAEMNAATEEREAVAAEATADKEELEAIEAEREYQQELREAEEAIEAAKREEQEAVEAMAKAELEEQEAIEAEKISIERGQDSEKAKLLMESKLIAAREAEDIAAMEEEEARQAVIAAAHEVKEASKATSEKDRGALELQQLQLARTKATDAQLEAINAQDDEAKHDAEALYAELTGQLETKTKQLEDATAAAEKKKLVSEQAQEIAEKEVAEAEEAKHAAAAERAEALKAKVRFKKEFTAYQQATAVARQERLEAEVAKEVARKERAEAEEAQRLAEIEKAEMIEAKRRSDSEKAEAVAARARAVVERAEANEAWEIAHRERKEAQAAKDRWAQKRAMEQAAKWLKKTSKNLPVVKVEDSYQSVGSYRPRTQRYIKPHVPPDDYKMQRQRARNKASALKQGRSTLEQSFVRLPALTPRASRQMGLAYSQSPRLPVVGNRFKQNELRTACGLKFRL